MDSEQEHPQEESPHMVTFTQKAKDALKKMGSAITLHMENKNACYG